MQQESRRPLTSGLLGFIVLLSIMLTLWTTLSLRSSGEKASVKLLVKTRQENDGFENEGDNDLISGDPWPGTNTEQDSAGFGNELWSELFGSSSSSSDPEENTAGEWFRPVSGDDRPQDDWASTPKESPQDESAKASTGRPQNEWTPVPTDRPQNQWAKASTSPQPDESSPVPTDRPYGEWANASTDPSHIGWAPGSTKTASGESNIEAYPETNTSAGNVATHDASSDWGQLWDSESDTTNDDDRTATIVSSETSTKPTTSTHAAHAWGPSEKPMMCDTDPRIADFCIIPEGLQEILGGSEATTGTIYNRIFADDVIRDLNDKCTRYDWCLDNDLYRVSYKLLSNIMFWDSDEYEGFCWPGLSTCLRTVVDYYDDCEAYEELDFTVRSLELLCAMRSESTVSTPCIGQVLKLLHTSMASEQKSETSETLTDLECQSPEASMSKLLLCATSTCVTQANFLYDFIPWAWFSRWTSQLQSDCNLMDQAGHYCPPSEDTFSTSTANTSMAYNASDENQIQLDEADAEHDAVYQEIDSQGIPVEEASSKLVLALSLVCVITVFVLAIMGFAFWRRMVRSRSKPGTGKCFKDGVKYFEIESPVEDEDE